MSRDEALLLPDQFPGTPHPRTRATFIGHAAAERAFLQACAADRLPAAWLLGGPAGIGKATLAYRVARRLLALGPDPLAGIRGLDVDLTDRAARLVAAGAHPGLVVLRRSLSDDGRRVQSQIPVSAARKVIDFFGSTSVDGSYRVAIVDSADDFNASSAQRAAEGHRGAAAGAPSSSSSRHAPDRVLPTIRSRCRRLDLRPLADAEVARVIDTLGPPWSEEPPAVREAAVKLGDGSVRRALERLDGETIAFVGKVRAMLERLPDRSGRDVLGLVESFARRDSEARFELLLDTAGRFAQDRLRSLAEDGQGASRLAPLVEVCDKVARSAREIDVYNLDRRPLILAAVRRSGGGHPPDRSVGSRPKEATWPNGRNSTSRRRSPIRTALRISATPTRSSRRTRSPASSGSTAPTCSS